MTETQSAWSKDNPNIQFALDSTTLRNYLTCPRKFYYTNILGYRKKSPARALEWGIAAHKCLEIFDKAMALEEPLEQARHKAVSYAMTEAAKKLNECPVPDTARTPETLTRAVIEYINHYQNDPAKTHIITGVPAVEQSFQFSLGITTPGGEDYTYCGHLDKLVNFSGELWVLDRKTTKTVLSENYFKAFQPDTQMTGYVLGGKIALQQEVVGVLIDGIQTLVKSTRFARHTTYRTERQLDEFMSNLGQVIKKMELDAEAESFPMNTEACHHYGGCPFRTACAADPSVRGSIPQRGLHY